MIAVLECQLCGGPVHRFARNKVVNGYVEIDLGGNGPFYCIECRKLSPLSADDVLDVHEQLKQNVRVPECPIDQESSVAERISSEKQPPSIENSEN